MLKVLTFFLITCSLKSAFALDVDWEINVQKNGNQVQDLKLPSFPYTLKLPTSKWKCNVKKTSDSSVGSRIKEGRVYNMHLSCIKGKDIVGSMASCLILDNGVAHSKPALLSLANAQNVFIIRLRCKM